MELNWSTFALEIINFIVLIWLLSRFFYRPIRHAIEERRANIEKTLADAQRLRSEGEELQKHFESRLAEWEDEKASLRSAFRTTLEAERAKQLTELRGELDRERVRSEAAAAARMRDLELSLERKAIAQSTEFCAKLVTRFASPALEAQIVNAAIVDLTQLPPQQREILARSLDGNPVHVTSRFPLAPELRIALANSLAAIAGRTVSPEFIEDSAVIAGVRIEAGSWVLEADLADELHSFGEMNRS